MGHQRERGLVNQRQKCVWMWMLYGRGRGFCEGAGGLYRGTGARGHKRGGVRDMKQENIGKQREVVKEVGGGGLRKPC